MKGDSYAIILRFSCQQRPPDAHPSLYFANWKKHSHALRYGFFLSHPLPTIGHDLVRENQLLCHTICKKCNELLCRCKLQQFSSPFDTSSRAPPLSSRSYTYMIMNRRIVIPIYDNFSYLAYLRVYVQQLAMQTRAKTTYLLRIILKFWEKKRTKRSCTNASTGWFSSVVILIYRRERAVIFGAQNGILKRVFNFVVTR